MQQRNGARELGLVVATLGVLVHFVDTAPAAVVTVLIAAAAAAGTGAIVGDIRPWRMPLIPMVLPVLGAFAIAGIARMVGPVPWLGLVFVAGWAVLAWIVRLEALPAVAGTGARRGPVGGARTSPPTAGRPGATVAGGVAGRYPHTVASQTKVSGPGSQDASLESAAANPSIRMRPKRRPEFDIPLIVAEPIDIGPELPAHPRPVAVRAASLGLAFVAFVAVGGLVPGALALDAGPVGMRSLAATVALDVLIGGFVGYRIASISSTSRFDRVVRVLAFVQYAVPVGVFGAALRLMALPRLFGPALLTLVVYVVTVLRESPDPVASNRRLLQEMAILAVAGALAVAWGLLVR
jgi:hypothetical protein